MLMMKYSSDIFAQFSHHFVPFFAKMDFRATKRNFRSLGYSTRWISYMQETSHPIGIPMGNVRYNYVFAGIAIRASYLMEYVSGRRIAICANV